jgi:putative Ca2+/H+ antiporter (TMEM165/GDT1 family)
MVLRDRPNTPKVRKKTEGLASTTATAMAIAELPQVIPGKTMGKAIPETMAMVSAGVTLRLTTRANKCSWAMTKHCRLNLS